MSEMGWQDLLPNVDAEQLTSVITALSQQATFLELEP